METLPQDIGFLTALLKALIQTFTLGYANLIPELLGLITLLAILEMTVMGAWALYDHRADLIGTLAVKVTWLTVLVWLVGEWPHLIRVVFQTFLYFGLRAGGDTITLADISDPSNIMSYGFSVAWTVAEPLENIVGMDVVYHAGQLLLSVPLAFVIMGVYFVLAIWLFILQVEFFAAALLAVCLAPFGALRYTNFIAEKALAYLVSAGIQIMGVAFCTAVALPLMVRLQGGLHPTFHSLTYQLGGGLTLLALAWRVNKLAATVSQGFPQLTIHDATSTAKTVASAVNTTLALANSAAHTGGMTLQRRRD